MPRIDLVKMEREAFGIGEFQRLENRHKEAMRDMPVNLSGLPIPARAIDISGLRSNIEDNLRKMCPAPDEEIITWGAILFKANAELIRKESTRRAHNPTHYIVGEKNGNWNPQTNPKEDLSEVFNEEV